MAPVHDEIPDDRPLSAAEEALTRWLLVHGRGDAATYLPDLARARVAARCGCGCASVEFAVAGVRPGDRAGLEQLADYRWRDSHGRLAGVFVWASDATLAGLTVWPLDPWAALEELPAPAALEPPNRVGADAD
jgi:hypothetical protein